MEPGSVFELFGELPEQLKPTGDQILSFINTHLNTETRVFDWKAFKNDIDYYEGADMIFDKYKTLTLDQQPTKISDLTTTVAEFIKGVLPVEKTTEELEAIFGCASLDWKDKKAQGFADFALEKPKPEDPSIQKSSRSSGGLKSLWGGGNDKPKPVPVKSSYTYRVVFQIQSPRLESDFYSLVSTVKIIADFEKEEDWWTLEATTEKDFGVDIIAMELVVTQGFKNPVA